MAAHRKEFDVARLMLAAGGGSVSPQDVRDAHDLAPALTKLTRGELYEVGSFLFCETRISDATLSKVVSRLDASESPL